MTVNDVAAYILDRRHSMSAMKLQKLVFYSQAWSLVWDDRPLFPEVIEAWANGPVCPALYRLHSGLFEVRSGMIRGDIDELDPTARETVDLVLDFYGNHTAQWLSDLTHAETPWIDARGNLPPGARGGREITHEAMAEYYGSLPPNT